MKDIWTIDNWTIKPGQTASQSTHSGKPSNVGTNYSLLPSWLNPYKWIIIPNPFFVIVWVFACLQGKILVSFPRWPSDCNGKRVVLNSLRCYLSLREEKNARIKVMHKQACLAFSSTFIIQFIYPWSLLFKCPIGRDLKSLYTFYNSIISASTSFWFCILRVQHCQ